MQTFPLFFVPLPSNSSFRFLMKDGFAKGFLIGAALIFVGLALEWSIGPVAWSRFAWPANGVVFAVFLAMIAAMFRLRRRVPFFGFIGSHHAAIPALVYAVALTVVMGLTRQLADGSWLHNMLSFWPFVLIYVYIALILGLTILRQIKAAATNFSSTSRFSLLFHLGLFIAITTATLGHADMERVKMILSVGQRESTALTRDGFVRPMPMTIELKRFVMETYDDGAPKRFASEILILTKKNEELGATVEVNKPVSVNGWKIYQNSYDTRMGAKSRMSILELVRDPWLPLVYSGIYLMLGGAFLLFLSAVRRHSSSKIKRFLPILSILALVFVVIVLFKNSMQSKTLVPALQSPWFAPHVVVYMFAYTALGLATLMALWQLFRKTPASLATIDRLVSFGLAFMTVGMLFGALWAKEAWGHYWSWDPKETWAAITWFSYLVFIHYRRLPSHRPRLALCLLLVCFALLQMCWWGINYLPSAQATSIHTYQL